MTGQPRRGGDLGQRLLLALIAGYRRFLSGRGPLRRVRCTFHRTESCSTYGLRCVHEAEHLWSALVLIWLRLRRCGRASLYRDGRELLWDDYYDRPYQAIAGELERSRERPSTVSAVLGSRLRVARYRGERLLPSQTHDGNTLVRTAAVLDHKRGKAWRSSLACSLAALGLLAVPLGVLSYGLAALLATIAVVYASRARRLRLRRHWFSLASRFSRVGISAGNE
jgi:putative component of membrane protein insertase Oxa1/YidC/SpoIIIJ protein YidD